MRSPPLRVMNATRKYVLFQRLLHSLMSSMLDQSIEFQHENGSLAPTALICQALAIYVDTSTTPLSGSLLSDLFGDIQTS